jgi:hypothetical protein
VIDVDDAPPDPDGNDRLSWRVDVESVEKGGAAPLENVLTGTKGDTCAPGFEIERRYQIFTSRNSDGRLETNLCAGTHVLEEKQKPVKVEPTRPPAAPTDEPGETRAHSPTARGTVEPGTAGASAAPGTDHHAVAAAAGRDEGANSIRKWAITVLVWAILAIPVVLLTGRRKPKPTSPGV